VGVYNIELPERGIFIESAFIFVAINKRSAGMLVAQAAVIAARVKLL